MKFSALEMFASALIGLLYGWAYSRMLTHLAQRVAGWVGF
jgi:hypothetical protein